MRIFIFGDDLLWLDLLAQYLINNRHSVQKSSSKSYRCPHFQSQTPNCATDKPCVDAIIVNARVLKEKDLIFLRDLEIKKCKIPTQNKLIFCSTITPEQDKYIKMLGFSLLLKPLRFSSATLWVELYTWLKECGRRLERT